MWDEGSRLTVRVVIADDSLLDRAGVRRMLESSGEFEIAAVVSNLESLYAAVDQIEPHVIVTELFSDSHERHANLAWAEFLARAAPRVGVLVLSRSQDPRLALALFEGGTVGRGYLLKSGLTTASEFMRAVSAVARGGSVIDPSLIPAITTLTQGRSMDYLTPRQRQVLGELAAGKSNAGIASSLGVTRRAVEHLIAAIFARLELTDATDTSRRVAAALIYLRG